MVPRRRLALQIAAPTAIEPICSEQRPILSPAPPSPPSLTSHPTPLLTPLIPPPVNNWLMVEEMSWTAAGQQSIDVLQKVNAVTLTAERRKKRRRSYGSFTK